MRTPVPRLKMCQYADKSRQRAKAKVLEHYGGAHCKGCGFNHPDALCLDHKDGGGGKLRKAKAHPWGGYALYVWLIKRNYPSGFQVLCFNCNAINSVQRLRAERRKRVPT